MKKNDRGSRSLGDYTDFNFDLPEDILIKKYQIVFDISFDEAEAGWIFINPLTGLNVSSNIQLWKNF